MFDFKELEAFVAIVRTGSFRLAARRLHITQPAISERIHRLEQTLDAPLLDRRQRPIKATRKGHALLGHAERLIQARHEAIAALLPSEAIGGQLRLGIVESLAQRWLTRLLEDARERFPSLVIEVEIDVTPHLAERMISQELDLAFLIGPLSAQRVVNHALCKYPTTLVVHPSLLERYRGDAHRLLEEIDFIAPLRNSRAYIDVRAFLDARGLEKTRIHCSSSMNSIAQMAQAGLGVGAVPLSIAEPLIVRGELIPLPFTLPPHEFTASWLASSSDPRLEALTQRAIAIANAAEASD